MNKYLLTFLFLLHAPLVSADSYTDAWKEYYSQNYHYAMQVFSELANQGNIYCQAIVGVYHAAKFKYIDEKEPDPYEPSIVLAEITKKHKSGDLEATFLLALMHDEGWAANQDKPLSKRLYIQASEAGHTAAQTLLAEYYELGIAGDKDIESAIYWYKKASEGGSVLSKVMIKQLQ